MVLCLNLTGPGAHETQHETESCNMKSVSTFLCSAEMSLASIHFWRLGRVSHVLMVELMCLSGK